MAKVVPFKSGRTPVKQLGLHDAKTLVQRLAQNSNNVFVVSHGKARQGERGISRRQIMKCLQKGVITEGPFRNKFGNWQVNMTRLAAGEEITCVVAIEDGQLLVVITAF